MVSCQNCKARNRPDQMFNAVWKKKGQRLRLCPVCFVQFHGKEVKNLETSKTEQIVTGLDNIGIKSQLEKWGKYHQSQV